MAKSSQYNGTKYSTSPSYTGNNNELTLSEALFGKEVPEVASYVNLMTGRRFELSYEPQTGSVVSDGNDLIRAYSPFVIQYVPPADSAYYVGDMFKGDAKINVDTITTGLKALDPAEFGSYDTPQEVVEYLAASSEDSLYQQSLKGDIPTSFVGSAQALSYASQLYQLMKLPPLQFLINPTSMAISYTKVQDYSERTRRNRIFRAWGEEQPKITFSAKTAGFIAKAGNDDWKNNFTTLFSGSSPTEQGPSGLQFASKRNSAAWQNFLKILQMYQNAALIYDKLHDTEAHLGVGSFAVHYDQMTYLGLIETFDFSYAEDTPHTVEFNFEFTVSQMYDWCTASIKGTPSKIKSPSEV